MSKKQRKPVEESFTLQFGEPDEDLDAPELDLSEGVFVEENFMWQNATAFLDEALPNGGDAADGAEALEHSAGVDPDAPVELPLDDNVEPLVVDERQAGAMLRGPQDGVDIQQEDMPDDDGEPMVLDERQMAMVTAPDEASDFDEPDLSTLRADPSQSVVRRVTQEPDAAPLSGDDPAGALFVDDDDNDDLLVVPPSESQGTKTPWLIYGTFGLGVAVVGVAAIGMLLQLGKTAPDAAVAGTTAPQVQDQAGVLADVAVSAEPTDLDPQLTVERLAVGPFVQSESRISVPKARLRAIDYQTPLRVAAAEPDADYTPDLRASLPTALAAVEVDGLTQVVGDADTDVVTVATDDRIELDLTGPDEAGSTGETVASDTIASVTIDPKIDAGDAPQLATVEEAVREESPQDARASLGLFTAISQLSQDVSALDAVVLKNLPEAGALGDGAVQFATFDAPVDRAGLQPLAEFNLVRETLAGLAMPEQAEMPVAAVRLAAFFMQGPDVLSTQIDVSAMKGALDVGAPDELAGAAIPDPKLPVPKIDNSRQLMAAVKLLEEEKARLLAGETPRPEELTKAAELVSNTEPSVLPEPVLEPVAEVTATATPEADAPRAESETVQIVQADTGAETGAVIGAEVAVQAEAPKHAEISAMAAVIPAQPVWVREATWMPELGFSVSAVDQDGRKVLKVTQVTDASVLPDWAATGAEILSVNGDAVESEEALIAALLGSDSDLDAGLAAGVLEIRARAGLDPRIGRVSVPVWRGVTLGDGTKLSVRLDQGKWLTEVLSRETADAQGLQTGDILLRDFATKSKLAGPLDLETVFEATTEAGDTRVEFAVMRDGELASGGVSLE